MTWRVEIRLRLGELDLDVVVDGDTAPVALIGPNGSGKTTLLRTIAGAYRPSSGRIQVGDLVLLDTATGIDLAPEARRVGYVPQGYGLFPHLSVLDNVAFGRSAGHPKTSRAERRAAASSLLERMECSHLCERLPAALSGGEQQRIALARALMIDPQMLLLDEPLSALDAPARRGLRGFLKAHLTDHSGPSIVVTHDVRDVLMLASVICVVDRGRIVQRGTAEELARDPATDFVAEFFEVVR